MAPPRRDPEILVYTVGRGFRTDEEQDLAERVASLHSDPDIRTLCHSILDSANSYLTLINSPTTGRGYAAQRVIPSDLDICFYSGTIKKRNPASYSNHYIDLGIVSSSHVVVDGQPSADSAIRPGSMQMVNHACSANVSNSETTTNIPPGLNGPNCTARYVESTDGLGIWVLRTSRTIQEGEQLSFDYGGSFWSTGFPGATRAGRTLVRCCCRNSFCPRGRWRWERPTYHLAPPTQQRSNSQCPQSSLQDWLVGRNSIPSSTTLETAVHFPPTEAPPAAPLRTGGSQHSVGAAAGRGFLIEQVLSPVDYDLDRPQERRELHTDTVNPLAPLGESQVDPGALEALAATTSMVASGTNSEAGAPQTQPEPTTASTRDLPPWNNMADTVPILPPATLDSSGLPHQHVLTINVGPVGIRDCLEGLTDLFRSTPAVVFIQEAKLPPRAVKSLKSLAHRLLPHYCLFVGKLPGNSPGDIRHEVVTFVHIHLAARASLLEVTRQAQDPAGTSPNILLSRTHFVRTTDVYTKVSVLWGNVYAFQASNPVCQESQWEFISAVIGRWESQTDHIILGGDFNASLATRWGYRSDSQVHVADARIRRFVDQLSLTVTAPQAPTWTSVDGSRRSTLDFFLFKTAPSGAPTLISASALLSPDARHDHMVVRSTLLEGVVSPLPALEDMRSPPRLKMGAFSAKRDRWSALVSQRVLAVPDFASLDTFERLDIIKEESLRAAREVLGTSGGKLRPAIRFHCPESIKLSSLLRTLKAARRDILGRKGLSSDRSLGPSKAMKDIWHRGIVPLGGSFSFLSDPFSPPHADFTKSWLALLQETTAQTLQQLKQLREDQRKHSEAQSRAHAVLRMYQRKGELRRFLHDTGPQSPAPFLVSPLPDRLILRSQDCHPESLVTLISSLDQRLRVSLGAGTISVCNIPPCTLHSVLSTPGIAPGISWASNGDLVSDSADRLCCWEFKLALDGLATRSRCCSCRNLSLLPVPLVAGESRRVDLYCTSCSAFRHAFVDPEDYKDLSFLGTAKVPQVPHDAPERLADPISVQDLEWYLSTLPSHKAPGPDGIPYECFKYGPPCVRDVVLEAVNTILSNGQLMPTDWKGGLIRYLHKKGDKSSLDNYRPICLQDAVYKVLSAVLTDRLYRISEKYGLLADSQEGFRRMRSTTRQAQSLHWAFEDAARQKETLYVAYLDFENAFNSIDHEALWQWLERLGIPDIDLLRSLYRGAFYRAQLPYGTTARIQLTRGKKQGDLISPLLFELPFNVFLLALEATSVGLVRLFHKPRVGRGFADDVAIIGSSKQQMQTRLTKTAEFCRWSGMRVKVTKSFLSAYDFRDRKEADVTGILYEGHALQHLPPEEAFPYLGIRSSLTGCFRAEKEHVMKSVRELREQVAHHKYNLDQMVDAMHMVASSRFRYSAPLVPWTDAQLDRLHVLWIGLAKAAWRLPPSFPAAPLKLPLSQGGSPVPHPRVYLVQALSTHIEQLVALPDDLRDRTILQYRRLCHDTGCNTVAELTDFLSKEGKPRPCPIARFLRACGQLDLKVKLPDCLSLGPGENETSWHCLFTHLQELSSDPTDQSFQDFSAVHKRWSAIRLALRAKGFPQPRCLILDTRAQHPQWRHHAFVDPWLRPLHRLLQRLPPEVRRKLFPRLDRGRRPVVEEVHRLLLSDTLKALSEPAMHAPLLRDAPMALLFRDPRWPLVRCRELPHTWQRLLTKHQLKDVLRRSIELHASDPTVSACSGIVRDVCALGLSGLAPRHSLLALLSSVAYSFSTLAQPESRESPAHPFRDTPVRLSRDLVSITWKDPPGSVIEAPPFRITTRQGKCTVERIPETASPPVHIGTVTQGRFSRLCAQLGQDKVLQSLHAWIVLAEKSERSRGVASAQFWRGLRLATNARGYIGGPALLLPPFFEWSIPADDAGLQVPLPSGARKPRRGRYIVDCLHTDTQFQARIRVLLANPTGSEFVVVTRPSTLDKDTHAMLERRYIRIHVFPRASLVVAKKANWSLGAFTAIQSSEEWTIWAPKSLSENAVDQLRQALGALTFSKDGLVPFDSACPSMTETKLGPSGPLYAHHGILAATDGSVKKDGSMGASVVFSDPDLHVINFEVHGPAKSNIPELAAIAAAARYAPMDKDLTILTDSQDSLQLLTGMQRHDFPLFLHRRIEKQLLEGAVKALNNRASSGARTSLVKVKAHAGEPLNSLADWHASRAVGHDPTLHHMDSDRVYFFHADRPIAWGPKLRKHLIDVAATRLLVLLRASKTSRDLRPQGDLAQMNWTETFLTRQECGRSLLGAALAQMETDAGKRRLLQTLAGTFPCRSLLHRWGRADSAQCPLCGALSESQSHIQCLCPSLKEARIAAHHQIARCLWTAIEHGSRSMQRNFTMAPETQVDAIRDLAPPHLASSWDRIWAEFFSEASQYPVPANLARLRPDAVVIRWNRRCLYLLEVTRPYDSRADFANRPALRDKLAKYQVVADLLRKVAPRWSVHVLPFTIGVRGTLDVKLWSEHLTTLGLAPSEIPRVLQKVVTTTLSVLDVVYDARTYALRTAAIQHDPTR